MKALVCEMCNSNDLIKQDGVFVCQYCGTKYSVEEAKKLLETVKIDESGKIGNYLTMAENAYNSRNIEEAESYCNRIIEIDPKNYKAWLIKGKSAGWKSTPRNIRLEESVNCFSNAIDYAPEDVVEDVKKESASEMAKISKALVTVTASNFAKFQTEENKDEVISCLTLMKKYSVLFLEKYGVETDNYNQEVATIINAAVVLAWENSVYKQYKEFSGMISPTKFVWETFKDGAFRCIDITEAIIPKFEEVESKKAAYQNLVIYGNELLNSKGKDVGSYWTLSSEAKQSLIERIKGYHNKIKELDPSYEIPAPPVEKSAGGCYVATAVYGSYDCPQVWTLRRYRDDTLAHTWYGRAFIHTYYAVSPTLVKWFGNTNWFKNMWKPKLDRMVSNLNSEGVKNTPYEDKNW